MKNLKKCVLLATLATFLTACGVKGPLYFPEKAPTEQKQAN